MITQLWWVLGVISCHNYILWFPHPSLIINRVIWGLKVGFSPNSMVIYLPQTKGKMFLSSFRCKKMRTHVQQSLNFEVINMIQKTLDVCIGVIGLARHPELYVHTCYNLFFVWCFTETEEDFNVIQSLKETITKQRGQIKGLQSEVKHKDTEVEAVRFLPDLAAVTTPCSNITWPMTA